MQPQVLGILGGLGPLASAEFIKTIYQLNISTSERLAPICQLYSNPTVPKRQADLTAQDQHVLYEFLLTALEQLCQMGSQKIVIACITLHSLLDQLPRSLQTKVISLVEIILIEVLQRQEKYLLLCSMMTRQSQVFTQHPQWHLAESYILFPDDQDQAMISNSFRQLKLNAHPSLFQKPLEMLLKRYEVAGWISGCTEFHLVHKHLLDVQNRQAHSQVVNVQNTSTQTINNIIDPLWIVAQRLTELLAVES
ncbi:MAG: aspartate/glutamate racemase family protein [Cyanobacteria bacterium P01_H01_bin.121]